MDYEGMLLIDPKVEEEGLSGIRHKVEEAVRSGEGSLSSWEGWGRRKLASRAKGRTEATYILFTFRGGEEILNNLRKICRLSENILKYFFVRKDSRR